MCGDSEDCAAGRARAAMVIGQRRSSATDQGSRRADWAGLSHLRNDDDARVLCITSLGEESLDASSRCQSQALYPVAACP